MPPTLLLADDSVTIQRVIELTFADEDVRVVAVSDGDEAIASIEADAPDIVLADVGMPGRSGYDVAAHIKRTPALAHIPVLLLTGAFEPIDEERARTAGSDGVLAKPFEPQLVIARVRELLERSGAGTAESEAAPAAESDWPSGIAEPDAPAPPAEPVGQGVDEYFDRLDAAFSTLQESGRGYAPPAPPAFEAPAFGPPDYNRAAVETPEGAAPGWPRGEAPAATVAPVSVAEPALPTLSDAFAAILAAEREAVDGGEPAAWPARSDAPDIDEAMIEEIAERVVRRLSDRLVRETVADTVSQIAERLVREEIARIKAHVK